MLMKISENDMFVLLAHSCINGVKEEEKARKATATDRWNVVHDRVSTRGAGEC